MFKDLYTGSPWSLLCSSCPILQSVFYTGSKVYWGKMGSVLWPAAHAKGIEREELFCGQKGCASCLISGDCVWCPSCSDPHPYLIPSQLLQVLQDPLTFHYQGWTAGSWVPLATLSPKFLICQQILQLKIFPETLFLYYFSPISKLKCCNVQMSNRHLSSICLLEEQ